MILEIFSFAVIGVLAGVLSGLLGISGGVVTIPCLLLVFGLTKIPSSAIMHLAIGTSLAAMVFNTLSASYAHYKKEAVLFYIVKPMAIGIVMGAMIGVTIAQNLSSHFLQLLFGGFELLLGIRYFLPEKKYKTERTLPPFWGLSAISLGVSTISTMLGIGGGIINVPILTHFHVSIKQAIGTSAVLSFLTSVFGGAFFLFGGLHKSPTDEAIGYLYLPAFIIIGIISFFSAPYGVKLAHRLPIKILRRIFGIALFITGGIMLFS